MISASSGNAPVLSLEKSRSPSTSSSKRPPSDGMSVRFETCCLNSVRILAAKLTAWGS